ncbi:electron transfer flavoprotein subunit alpha/FixB family protein [Legionella dresdenensis]|uniref:Electron transfer flavoprotein subunit alpha/FixB family protein n=1 Tax=Legionella dresdenensis TaxID=450200 RepID=A0ABV8CCL8_9GAMM
MSTLVIVEHDNEQISPATYSALAAARQLDQTTDLLVAGYQCSKAAEQAAALAGVTKVIAADNACYSHFLAENLCQLVLSIADNYTTILAASTTFGKNLMPRIAAKLDVIQVSDVMRIIDGNTFEHPIYAGNAIETVKVLDSKKVLTIRSTAFDNTCASQSPCTIETLDKAFTDSKVTFVSQELSKSERPELGSAKVVVSGGRGLQSAEKFKLVEQLADELGAAVGASRAAVDAGFVPNDYQVGQTGKVVAPDLYIALGISGAVQHLAGMKDSKVIVAVNKDPDAPIFQIATYGLVGDVFELVPQLIEQLKR